MIDEQSKRYAKGIRAISQCAALLFGLHLHGQSPKGPVFSDGELFPDSATLGDILLWRENGGLYQREAKNWKRIELPDGVVDVFTCQALAVAELPLRTSIIFPDLVRNYPVKAIISCWDSLAELNLGDSFVLVDIRVGKSADERQLTPQVTKKFHSTCMIDGVMVWCVPAFLGNMSQFSANEFRNWGAINARGQWVIEPRYDKPFRFIDGVARVIHYGQKRKINLRGEFVD